MPRHHHVNLAGLPGQLDPEADFLVDILGYRRVDIPADVRAIAPAVRWFEGADGSQIHLSEDPDHRPAARAHVAVELTAAELEATRQRLEQASVAYSSTEPRPGFPHVLFAKDPAGNRWELRGPLDALATP